MTPGGTSGVPTAPSRIASKPRSSASVSSESTSPVARYRRPPRSYSVVSRSTPAAPTTPSATPMTSGPMPSPPMMAMRCVTVVVLLAGRWADVRSVETKDRPPRWTVRGERRGTAFARE